MSDHELNPPEVQTIVRRHVHDLRNTINCMDLEIASLLEDGCDAKFRPALEKVRRYLTLAERTAQSLSTRFAAPSLNPAAASDLYCNWREQVCRLPGTSGIQWAEPSGAAGVEVDFAVVTTVLVELCLKARPLPGDPPLIAGVRETADTAVFYVRQSGADAETLSDLRDSPQWREWERMVRPGGGHLECTVESAGGTVSLVFPRT